jgi:transposase
MSHFSRENWEIPAFTLGMDLGDKQSDYCLLDVQGKVIERGQVSTRRRALEEFFAQQPSSRAVIECGTHSRWVEQVAVEAGHEVIVSNPRRVALISGNRKKRDPIDAQMLARLGRFDPELLFPIRHRGEEAQRDLALIKARDELVKARTQFINHIRGRVKSMGERLPSCSASSFPRQVWALIPESLRAAIEPLLDLIDQFTRQIRDYEREIERLCEDKYPETAGLRQINGVGALTSLAYVLVLEDPHRFGRSREVGAYLGFTPKQDQSGEHDPQLRITKEGDELLRRLLVSAAHYILGPFGPDCDLRRGGEKVMAGGGKYAKKRAVVAVGRKLSVLLHHLWITDEEYDPFYNSRRQQAQAA